MSLQGPFWRFAHQRYQTRKPSRLFEIACLLWGLFWLIVFATSVIWASVGIVGFLMMLVFSAGPIAIALLHRRIRLVRENGSDALYRKRLASNG